ncbi:double-stranded RNA binding motif domain-containing protein [Acaryochloris marina]|uniref:double-stranded RNA binding motif domain-containing protein n=1 Tax=Acaryochloris marina TaxID=155978 RepID=UPI002017E0C6|nr:double-stranded RNA binding motif domain-containing protein [Acaryochloris marina]
MADQLTVTTERIDDVVLLLHMMMQIGLSEVLNKHLPRHWKQEGFRCSVLVMGLKGVGDGRSKKQAKVRAVGKLLGVFGRL